MRVMTISDNPNLFTGLARIHRHLISALVADGHCVLPCVWFGYNSEQIVSMSMGEAPPLLGYAGVRMLPVHKKGKQMAEMKDVFDICEAFKPDVILTIGDHTDFYYMPAIKSKLDYSFKWIAYLTTEISVGEDMRPVFAHADKVLVPSSHSKACLKDLCDAEILPYGVEEEFKRKKISHEGKVFVTVATNTWRKDLPVILQGLFHCKQRSMLKECSFYIHTNTYAAEPCDPCYYDLKSIAAQLGVSDLVSFPEHNSVFAGESDARMSEIYAKSDFFILPSICESFALPLVEAMASGVIPIGNNNGGDHSAVLTHISDGRGIPIMTRTEFLPPAQMVRRVEDIGVMSAIGYALDMTDENYQKVSKKCTIYAKEFKWDMTEKRICELVSGISVSCEIPIEIIS